MAKIEIVHPENENFPASTETIEVRVWDLVGTAGQVFYIGSGVNFQANGSAWLEIIYSVEGAQIFYTRNFLHDNVYPEDATESIKRLDALAEKGEGTFGFYGMLPATHLELTAEKKSYKAADDQDQTYLDTNLIISADTGAVFGRTGPEARSIEIRIDAVELEDGVQFMRSLVHELDAVRKGHHPDPAGLPPGSGEWPFVWQLNRQAYNRIAVDYQEDYFNIPKLRQAFDNWLAHLPAGGQVLDAGCGHGDPVIARLLEKGFRVTGSDFSPEMLRRARQRFPQAAFVHRAMTQLDFATAFDGACSFSSLLYLDPVDFYHSLYRLHCALKPGGLLFLYGNDNGPSWRGGPFGIVIGQWMWSWHYGMQEAALRLEEHGYFHVMAMARLHVNEAEEQRVAQEIEHQKQEEEEYNQHRIEVPSKIALPYFPSHPEMPPYAYFIVARRAEI